MTLLDEVGGDLHHLTRDVAFACMRFVRPLYRVAEANTHPEAHGTCVLAAVDGQPLVMTAAHVLEEPSDQFLVGLEHDLHELTGRQVIEGLPERPEQDEHLYDVGFVVPNDNFLRRTRPGDFLSLAHLDRTGYAPRETQPPYLMLGFPAADITLDTERRSFECRPLSLTTSVAPTPQHAPNQMDRTHQFLLRMNPDELQAEGGVRDAGPALFGASGGAVFSIGDTVRTGVAPSIIGVAIEWWRGDNAVLCTDLRQWVETYRRARSEGRL